MEETLEQQLKNIEKEIGITARKVKDQPIQKVEVISTGSLLFDEALGVGGFPRGRIIEIFGQPSGGKSTLSVLSLAQVQKNGGNAALIDMENAFDPTWGAKLGLDVPNLFIAQPDYGEQAIDLVVKLGGLGKFNLIVVDSTAALVPKAEIDGSAEDQHIGLLARMMGKALRVLTPLVAKTKTALIFINQTRQNIGVMYGSPITTPGGEGLRFHSSIRVQVRKIGGSEIKEGNLIVGHRINISVVKNKVAAPFRTAEISLRFNSGIDKVQDLIEYAIAKNFLDIKGHTYSFGDYKWVGREKAIEGIRADLQIQEEMRKFIDEKSK